MDSVASAVVVGALSGFMLVTVESLLLWVLVLLFEVVFDAVSGGCIHCCWCGGGGEAGRVVGGESWYWWDTGGWRRGWLTDRVPGGASVCLRIWNRLGRWKGVVEGVVVAMAVM